MRSVVLFALLGLVAVCAVVDASKHHRGGGEARLASRFAELDAIKELNPKQRQMVERMVRAFESTLDKTQLDPAHKDAVKQKAMDHFMGRLAERKHGH